MEQETRLEAAISRRHVASVQLAPVPRRRVRTIPKLVRVVLLLATIACRTSFADELTLTRDGEPASVLVLPDSPSPAARQAAAILQDHVRAISGARLRIIAERELAGTHASSGKLRGSIASLPGTLVLVGEGRLVRELGLSSDGLGPGGICLQTFPNGLALFGADAKTPQDPWGTVYAAIALLEEPLGCRYLWPGPSGKIIPKRATIRIGELHVRSSPRILQRHIRDLRYSDRLQRGLDHLGVTRAEYERIFREAIQAEPSAPDWYRWQRLGGTMNLRAGHAFGHYWEKYGHQHPDWFALQPNGSRDQSLSPERARLCVTNPDLIEEIAREKLAQLAADPASSSVSISPNDGGRTTFCMCERCKRLDSPEGRKIQLMFDDASGGRVERRQFDYVSLTDRMVFFFNAIAERVTRLRPDALLVAYAYSAYSAPPVRARLHPNVVIGFVPMSYTNEAARAEALRDWDAWSRAASKIFFRPNCLLAGRREGTLLVYQQKLARDLRYLTDHGMIGADFDSCAHNWATQGLNYYVAARVLWNPDAASEAIVSDYCRAGFGPSEGPIREYFRQIEAITDKIAQGAQALTSPYTPDTIESLHRLLEVARRSVHGREDILDRITLLEQGLEFTAIQARAYRLLEPSANVERADAARLLDTRYWMMRRMFQDHHLAVNLAYVAWGEGGLWQRVGWKWQGPHAQPDQMPIGRRATQPSP